MASSFSSSPTSSSSQATEYQIHPGPAHGAIKPALCLPPGWVNGQQIIEGLLSGFMLVLGGMDRNREMCIKIPPYLQ
ncbi:hypothetical protein Vadar_011360 [Vaccinium darrowii]|uniref:Uncharacterized protein n=1 Tax=Vaccinium darrowii TaxID=229202 RepID=A0ACB7YLF7_9ERIC|nr:hypothetical protein Vadar_011360 [Vaccinium darrowii]